MKMISVIDSNDLILRFADEYITHNAFMTCMC